MKRSYVSIKKRFFHPDIRYQDILKPNNLIAHVKLQEFAQRVGYITALETSGKISPAVAYKQIKQLYKQLITSKKTTAR